ncbi:energy transducer TonB [Aquimarina sp. 2201CG14-23]|uniref:energy transducer TonB n=1 Tax=Aquimarina mycalae TaxID=3040073 RepID=UPI002477FB5A|nr:energy transducer TonB [Aquimarina sp. 2201CG14-23]MDH7445364.1 energy transducer TonB [Aquimarina sp. 2201CG14-23]
MSNKHDANVRKSTLVNFQVGLIASLLFTYVMFEMYTAVSSVKPSEIVSVEADDTEYTMDAFKVEIEPKKEVAAKSKKIKKPDWTKPKVVDDNTALKNLKKELSGENQKTRSEPISIDSIIDVGGTEDIVYPINKVAIAPIYPGCERYDNNDDRIACFSSKIRRLVSKKFNASLGEEYGLKGLQRIDVQFEVGKDGVIKEVKVRAPHPVLEKETRRVVGKFSDMQPAKIGDEAVRVKYILPITFKIHE